MSTVEVLKLTRMGSVINGIIFVGVGRYISLIYHLFMYVPPVSVEAVASTQLMPSICC